MDEERRRQKGPRCPTCKKPLPAALGPRDPVRPFCSERCKMVDLSKWLGGEHAIPGDEAVDLPDSDDN